MTEKRRAPSALTPDYLDMMRKTCLRAARLKGFHGNEQFCEDFAQYALEKIAAGSHRNVQFHLVDYIRLQFKRDGSHRPQNSITLDDAKKLLAAAAVEAGVDFADPVVLGAVKRGPMRAMLLLHHGYGWRLAEIAELFGMHENYLWKIMDEEMEKIRCRLKV